MTNKRFSETWPLAYKFGFLSIFYIVRLLVWHWRWCKDQKREGTEGRERRGGGEREGGERRKGGVASKHIQEGRMYLGQDFLTQQCDATMYRCSRQHLFLGKMLPMGWNLVTSDPGTSKRWTDLRVHLSDQLIRCLQNIFHTVHLWTMCFSGHALDFSKIFYVKNDISIQTISNLTFSYV